MSALTPDVTIAVVVVVVVVVFIIFVIVVRNLFFIFFFDFIFYVKLCCICRQCELCVNWTQRKSYARDDAKREAQREETTRQYDQARTEREIVRDEIRAKYNLKGGKTDIAVIS
jgi:hypothetical protein